MAGRRGAKKKPPHYNYRQLREALESGGGEPDALGHYVYEMMYDIYAGIEDEVLEGCVDTHNHIYPDYVPRTADVIRFAINCSRVGYRAIVCKDHFFTNVGMCWAAQWVCELLVRKGVLKNACKVLGTHVLTWSYHPDQIHLIRKYPNLGGVFFPTMLGGRQGGPHLPILDDKGNLMPEVKECIKLMADYHICIFTGHRNYQETKAMVEYGHEVGAHLLLTHAGGRWDHRTSASGAVAQAKELVKLGAWIEYQLDSIVGGGGLFPINDMAQLPWWINAMGPECIDHLVCGGDLGQPSATEPIEGARLGIRMLLHSGISMKDVKLMFQKNGADAIYLDEIETEVYTEDPMGGPEEWLKSIK
ncbi:DUF6282 family protein [Chloroflexota bacterium]